MKPSIESTPILYGEDAERVMKELDSCVPVSEEERNRIEEEHKLFKAMMQKDSMITLEDVWNMCDKEQKYLNEIISEFPEDDNKYVQGKIIAFREVQCMIKGECSK